LAPEVTQAKQTERQRKHGRLHPFQLAREVERQKKAIDAQRQLCP